MSPIRSHGNTVEPSLNDVRWMADALELARGTAARTWPNPPVGALVVRDGEVVGRGRHEGVGTPHAEPLALAAAGEAARGATLYVTLEPCNHQGATGPCAPVVEQSGVSRVVVAMRDPNPAVIGGGCRYLRDRGVEVTVGVLAPEALEMIWPFAVTDNFTRAFVELKTAHSLDGYWAPPSATRRQKAPVYLTGDQSRLEVHCRRRRADLVIVGEGTVIADQPRLDGRLAVGRSDVPGTEPLAAYVDTDLSWRGGFQRETYVVFAGRGALESEARQAVEADGGRVIFCREIDGHVDPVDLVVKARGNGFLSLMVEGGPQLAAAFLRAGVVDRWARFQAPVILGDGVGWPRGFLGAETWLRGFSLTSARPVGADLLAVYDRCCFDDVWARVTM